MASLLVPRYIVTRERKLEALRSWAHELSLPSVPKRGRHVGDGANDIPMISLSQAPALHFAPSPRRARQPWLASTSATDARYGHHPARLSQSV